MPIKCANSAAAKVTPISTAGDPRHPKPAERPLQEHAAEHQAREDQISHGAARGRCAACARHRQADAPQVRSHRSPAARLIASGGSAAGRKRLGSGHRSSVTFEHGPRRAPSHSRPRDALGQVGGRREFPGRLVAAAGGAAAARRDVLRVRQKRRRHCRQSRPGAGRQDRPPRAVRGGAHRPARARGRFAQGAGAAREPRRDRRDRQARGRHPRGVQAGRHQAALPRLVRSARLLRIVGIAGRPVSARSARRVERAVPVRRPLVRCAPGAQPPAGLPGRLPRARPGLPASREFRGRRHRGRGAGGAARFAGAARGARPDARWCRRSAGRRRRPAARAAQPAPGRGIGGDPGDGAASGAGVARARSARRAGRAVACAVPAVRRHRRRTRVLAPPPAPGGGARQRRDERALARAHAPTAHHR